MKRLVLATLVFTLMLSLCVGCGKKQPNSNVSGTNQETLGEDTSIRDDAQQKALSVIDLFVDDLELRDITACAKYLDPELQMSIDSKNTTIGKALGTNNAFGFKAANPTLTAARLFEDHSIELKMERKTIISEKQENNKAVYYITYAIVMDGTRFSTAIECECIVEFKLVNKENKWYIQSMREISQEADMEVLADGINIVSGTDFSDGVAFIQYKDDEGVYHAAAIDTTGKTLFELKDGLDFNRVSRYENGIMVIDDKIYDKTGKIIASPEISGYDELVSENCNGYVLAKKKEESFSGDKYYIGVINNKGEWEYPLSADNPIVKAFEKEEARKDDLYINCDYISETISKIRIQISLGYSVEYYYNIATNELTNGYVYYESRNYQGQSGIYQYDLSGNRTLVLKDITSDTSRFFFENAFIGTELTWDEDGYYIKSGYKIYDYSGNVITDLSQYKLTSNASNNGPGVYYMNGYLLIPVDNGNGAEYLCLINKSGETAFEPIRMGSWDDFYPLDETGFVYMSNENNQRGYKHYDFSGAAVEYVGVDYFGGFSDGLALVRNTVGQYYYINVKGEKVVK